MICFRENWKCFLAPLIGHTNFQQNCCHRPLFSQACVAAVCYRNCSASDNKALLWVVKIVLLPCLTGPRHWKDCDHHHFNSALQTKTDPTTQLYSITYLICNTLWIIYLILIIVYLFTFKSVKSDCHYSLYITYWFNCQVCFYCVPCCIIVRIHCPYVLLSS